MTDQTKQLPYLVRGGRDRLVQSAEPRVQHAAQYRTRSVVAGMFREVEVSGVDRKRVTVRPTEPKRPEGQSAAMPAFSATVEKSAAGIKSALRRLRPQEAKLLDAKDAEIAATVELLGRLRRERGDLVRLAWQRAHVVRLSELTLADDPKPVR